MCNIIQNCNQQTKNYMNSPLTVLFYKWEWIQFYGRKIFNQVFYIITKLGRYIILYQIVLGMA